MSSVNSVEGIALHKPASLELLASTQMVTPPRFESVVTKVVPARVRDNVLLQLRRRPNGVAEAGCRGARVEGVVLSQAWGVTATIRIDVVQVSFPNHLQAMPPPPPQPALYNRGTLVWQDNGHPKFDTT